MSTFSSISDWLTVSDELPEAILRLIKLTLGDYSPETIVSLKPIELAHLLNSKITTEGTGNDPWAEDAKDEQKWKKTLLSASINLIQQLKDFGYLPTEVKEPAQKQPQSIKIEMEQPLEHKSLKEKLAYAMLNPEESWVVLALIEQDSSYAKAAAKATQVFGYPKCIAFVSGMVAEDATVGYINWLSQEHSTPQQEWDGCELGTLKQALKIDEKLRLHPFLDEIINGPDKVGINYLELDEKDPELYDAIVWSRITRNPLYPSHIDLYENGTELLAHVDLPLPLTHRWEKIRKAFRSAKNGGTAKDGIRCEVSAKKPQASFEDALPPRSKEMTERDFKTLVYENIDAIPPSRNYQGSGQRINGVFRTISIHGSGCSLNITLLEGGSIQGSGQGGTIKIPEWNAQPSMHGSGCSVNIQKITWKQVAESMNLL